jgi:tRNA threonylcarbamoyladenosine biosynthesis protein TsaE
MAYMSIVRTWQTKSSSSEATEQLAERIGRHLKGGEVIELVSDLGGGKTTFTRGLVRGTGSKDKVASPTFTVSKLYDTDDFEIHHFDFYRLQEPGIIANELAEVTGDPKTVVVVEWADIVQDVMPEVRLRITLKQTPEGDREISLSVPQELDYLLEELE